MPITIEQLQSDAPELLAQIKQESFDRGVTQERGRVSEILAADGDAEVARKAIADGTPSGECFKLFFQAEKQKRVDGLKELAAQATPPQGNEEPPEAPPAKAAHLQLAEKARQIAAEKGIGLADAQRIAFEQNPELARAWTPEKPN